MYPHICIASDTFYVSEVERLVVYERDCGFCYEENHKNSRIRELVTEAINRDAQNRGQQSDKDVPATRLPCMVHRAGSTTYSKDTVLRRICCHQLDTRCWKL